MNGPPPRGHFQGDEQLSGFALKQALGFEPGPPLPFQMTLEAPDHVLVGSIHRWFLKATP